MKILKLAFEGLKPISKQNGTRTTAFMMAGKAMARQYLSDEYTSLRDQVKMLAKSQCNRKGWRMVEKKIMRVESMLWVPKGSKGPDIIDNALGAFYDAMQGVVYSNDYWLAPVYADRGRHDADWLVTFQFFCPE